MENGKQPITPCMIKGRQGFADLPTIPNREVYGLTKREYFAGLAMQGILSYDGQGGSSELYAKNAVQFADALLEELKNG
jgi:hypothetical protein